jgi:hypothetical protein
MNAVAIPPASGITGTPRILKLRTGDDSYRDLRISGNTTAATATVPQMTSSTSMKVRKATAL